MPAKSYWDGKNHWVLTKNRKSSWISKNPKIIKFSKKNLNRAPRPKCTIACPIFFKNGTPQETHTFSTSSRQTRAVEARLELARLNPGKSDGIVRVASPYCVPQFWPSLGEGTHIYIYIIYMVAVACNLAEICELP